MKKFVKSVLKITGFLAALSFINNRIKKSSDLSIAPNSMETDNLYYESRYGKIRYRAYGYSDKPKILLVHGLVIGGSLEEYSLLADKLMKDYQVFKIDMLGFGHSDKPDISYNSYLYTTLISEFIADVIRDRVSIVANGHSADFAFMVREMNPDIIEKLYLINPEGFVNESYGSIESKVFKGIVNLPIIGTTIINILSSKLFIRKYLQEEYLYDTDLATSGIVNNYYNNAHYNCENNKHALAHVFTNFIKVDTKKRIVGTDKDTVVILGEEVKKYDVQKVKSKLDKNENIKTKIVPLTRELVASEKPKYVYDIISGKTE